MPQRSQDWFRQAEADLRHALHARDDGDFDWAAFASHQAAEKAIKAVYQSFNLDAWGHMLTNLLTSLPAEAAATPALIDQARSSTNITSLPATPMVSNGARRPISTLGMRPRWPYTTRRQSLNSVVIKSVDKSRVRLAMDDLAEKLFSLNGELEEIVVFGSFETGDFIPGSDLDVFLALRASDKPVRERLGDFLPEQFPVPLDLFPFTRAEMCELAPSPVLDAVGRSRWRYRKSASNTN